MVRNGWQTIPSATDDQTETYKQNKKAKNETNNKQIKKQIRKADN